MTDAINLTVLRQTISMCRQTFADVADHQLHHQPAPGMNPPIWIMGHVVVTLDLCQGIMRQPVCCSDEWRRWFGPGSRLDQLPQPGPSRAELLQKLSEVSERLFVALPTLRPDDLRKPNETGFLMQELPTQGDILEYVLVSHTMLHVGQMTVWRRLMGLPSVVKIPNG